MLTTNLVRLQLTKFQILSGKLQNFDLFSSVSRIADGACEMRQVLQEEIDDREGFNNEAKQTVEWLTETKNELDQLSPSMEGPVVMEKIEKLKVGTETCFLMLDIDFLEIS